MLGREVRLFIALVSDDAPDKENSVEDRDKLTGSTSTGGCRLAGQRDGRPPGAGGSL